MLSRDEVEGVMAHELAHVKNRDTLIMTMVATIAGALSMLANFGLFFRERTQRFGDIARRTDCPLCRDDRATGDQPHARIWC